MLPVCSQRSNKLPAQPTGLPENSLSNDVWNTRAAPCFWANRWDTVIQHSVKQLGKNVASVCKDFSIQVFGHDFPQLWISVDNISSCETEYYDFSHVIHSRWSWNPWHHPIVPLPSVAPPWIPCWHSALDCGIPVSRCCQQNSYPYIFRTQNAWGRKQVWRICIVPVLPTCHMIPHWGNHVSCVHEYKKVIVLEITITPDMEKENGHYVTIRQRGFPVAMFFFLCERKKFFLQFKRQKSYQNHQ